MRQQRRAAAGRAGRRRRNRRPAGSALSASGGCGIDLDQHQALLLGVLPDSLSQDLVCVLPAGLLPGLPRRLSPGSARQGDSDLAQPRLGLGFTPLTEMRQNEKHH